MNTSTIAEPTAAHPFLGHLPIIPPNQEALATDHRAAAWESSLKPWDVHESWHLQEVARLSLRLDRIHQQEIALRHVQATQALAIWDEARKGVARATAAGLTRYPALVLARLRRFKQGCELIADRWTTLHDALTQRPQWTRAEHRLAQNLLDIPPDLRDAPSDLDAPPGTDPRDHRKAIAQREAQRHRNLAQALAPTDHAEREAAILGLAPDTPELAALHREERAIAHQLDRARAQFKSARVRGPIEPIDAPRRSTTTSRDHSPSASSSSSSSSSSFSNLEAFIARTARPEPPKPIQTPTPHEENSQPPPEPKPSPPPNRRRHRA